MVIHVERGLVRHKNLTEHTLAGALCAAAAQARLNTAACTHSCRWCACGGREERRRAPPLLPRVTHDSANTTSSSAKSPVRSVTSSVNTNSKNFKNASYDTPCGAHAAGNAQHSTFLHTTTSTHTVLTAHDAGGSHTPLSKQGGHSHSNMGRTPNMARTALRHAPATPAKSQHGHAHCTTNHCHAHAARKHEATMSCPHTTHNTRTQVTHRHGDLGGGAGALAHAPEEHGPERGASQCQVHAAGVHRSPLH